MFRIFVKNNKMKKLFLFLLICVAVSATGQSNFMNGPNTITITPQADSTFNDSTIVFTFNRDVLTWGTVIVWDSIASGTATIKMQVSNVNTTDNDLWIDYNGSLSASVTATTGVSAWEDDGFRFRYGRFVFDQTSLMASGLGSAIIINMFVKTQK